MTPHGLPEPGPLWSYLPTWFAIDFQSVIAFRLIALTLTTTGVKDRPEPCREEVTSTRDALISSQGPAFQPQTDLSGDRCLNTSTAVFPYPDLITDAPSCFTEPPIGLCDLETYSGRIVSRQGLGLWTKNETKQEKQQKTTRGNKSKRHRSILL